jgi:molybdate transport system permease protein
MSSMTVALSPLFDSLQVAALSAAAALLLAPWPAWAAATRDFRWKREILVLAGFLALTPGIVFGYLLLPSFSWTVAVAVSLVQGVPYLLRAARTAFAALPDDYRKAALMAGASDWRIFWRIATPLAYRPILMASLGVFVFTLLEFIATLLIAARLRGAS